MSEENPQSAVGESNYPQRRRSQRLTSPQANVVKMAPPAAVKRSIVVKKIAPRKTTIVSEHDKENTPKVSGGSQQKKKKDPTPPRARSAPLKPAMPSPILASSPAPNQKLDMDAEDLVWSQKVRRSYSRLSDESFNSQRSRETLFGFEQLKTPEVMHKAASKRSLEASGSLNGVSSFASLLEGEDSAPQLEQDVNIPGVAVVKEKRRRKKVQQIDATELDALSAKMNAEFEEAEGFELVVE